MTPGQLVKAVALALDVPEETVTQHDRNLVVTGLRTKGGRGRSAPSVTPLDAARLLVATLASGRIKDSAGIVRVFSKVTHEPPQRYAEISDRIKAATGKFPTDVMSRFSDKALDSLAEGHNIIDALAALIADASVPSEVEHLKRRFGAMTIGCHMPLARASIGRQKEIANYYSRHAGQGAASLRSQVEQREPHEVYLRRYGIHQDREIYGNVIMLLGKAFREGGLPFGSAQDALDDLLGVKKAKSKKKAT